jgi:hypothetical protein
MAALSNINIPNYTVVPIPGGKPFERDWYLFFLALWLRSGGTSGDTADISLMSVPEGSGIESIKAELFALEQEFRQLPPQQQVSFQNDGDQTPPFIPSGSDKKPGIDDQNPPSIPFIQVEFADSRIQALEAKVAELNKAIEGLQQGYQL